MSDSQKARDYADQKQLTADTINYSEHKHYNIDGKEADEYVLKLFENNFLSSTAKQWKWRRLALRKWRWRS